MVDKITTPVTPLEEVAKINEIIDNLGGGSSGGWSLLEHKWTDALLDDESWLLANNFSWHNKAAYEDAYDQLVDDIDGITPTTETVGSYTVTYYPTTSGRKIVLADQETTVSNIYTESGAAWYYILDTTNERFKLPRENPAREELIQVIRAKGDGTALGLTNGTNFYGLTSTQYTTTAMYNGRASNAYGVAIGTTGFSTGTSIASGIALGITSDSTKSGIISSMTDSTSVYKGKKYLYFYVGQYSPSATQQTAGLNTELFNGKADVDLSNAAGNASASAKDIIVRWCIPDYTAGVEKTFGTEYTAESNGFIKVFTPTFSQNNELYITIDGVQMESCWGANNNRINSNFCILPIKKGSTYSATYQSNQSSSSITFFPAIGG